MPCALFFDGEGEIRTLEPLLTVTRFPIVRARPATRLLHNINIISFHTSVVNSFFEIIRLISKKCILYQPAPFRISGTRNGTDKQFSQLLFLKLLLFECFVESFKCFIDLGFFCLYS